ncbi:hypothetical protein HMP0721_1130 [Pseudoramibacter alactolyticus ATCC 23263]|uniref:Uncharacterized protein n=1 Tax=Pseudoramibacter alactolyticus ATCC 23263 TaxID=887929 RepID=E6MGJ7_9FIRM|nr:hypothetical protein HMP0721_1130 [Pseudoramibacter alactolyticus ATCC 23263]
MILLSDPLNAFYGFIVFLRGLRRRGSGEGIAVTALFKQIVHVVDVHG